MEVSFHGHAVVTLKTESGTRIIFDPYVTGNPLCDLNAETLETDVILLTHAHDDHLGDTVSIAKRTNALVVTTVELAHYLSTQGVENIHPMQPGGAHDFEFGRVKLTPAIHGSSIEVDGQSVTLGLASGILFSADNRTVYHLGDTALYSDMQLIGRREKIDVAFIPIGDNFTMGPDDAVLAAEWLQPKYVIPVHYNTFPLINQDPQAFISRLANDVGLVPEIGEIIEL